MSRKMDKFKDGHIGRAEAAVTWGGQGETGDGGHLAFSLHGC